MIERIQTIKNVGTFKSHNNGSCELKKLSFIFGENSNGKSTITDIFKSYQKNASEIVINRKTVNATEDIEIKIFTPNRGTIEFNNDTWSENKSNTNPKDIRIFDTQFVQDNVFTNSKIEHGNKENFTEFVLGEKSNKINKELKELDEEKDKLSKEQDRIRKQITEKNQELDFEVLLKIELISDENAKTVDSDILGIKGNISIAQNNSKKVAEIKLLPMPNLTNTNNSILEKLTKYKDIFESKYSFSNEDIIADFEKHKQETINNQVDADSWLSKGIEIKKDANCPFCGSDIKDNALVKSYLTIFCEGLKKYNYNIDWLLDEKFKTDFSDIEMILIQNQSKVDKLRTNITHSKIVELSKTVEKNRLAIEEKLKAIKDGNNINKNVFEAKQQEKKENRYCSVQYDYSLLKQNIEELHKASIEYNKQIEAFITFAKKYLEELSFETLKKEIEDSEKVLKEKQYLFERNKWDKEINEYLKMCQKIKINQKTKKTKKDEFDKENNEFLKKYFESVNKYFKRLYSDNFSINKEESIRGKKKVYSLSLKYKNKLVESDKISCVLSESDRRALALSIFLSALEQDSNTDSIIIFDDPIVSFDIDRMNEFINIIKELSDNCKQIIIFTHYENFYKLLVQLTKNKDRSLIKIKHNKETNTFEMIDIENEPMLLDEFQKIINKAISFINENCDDYTSNDGRILMEKILGYRFAREIIDNTVVDIKNGLDKFLLDLKNKGKLTDDTYKALENKRVELNGPSHNYETHTLYSKRQCIKLLWDSLHEI